MGELGLKIGAVQVLGDACLQTVERRHQRLRNIAPAECAIAAAGIGIKRLRSIGAKR